MRMNAIEDGFEYQAKRILSSTLKGYDIEDLDDVDEFQDEIWNSKHILEELGRQFINALGEYSGDDVFQEAMEELAEEK